MSSGNHYQFSVHVETSFVPEQSNIPQHQYVFAYHITITNTGNVAAQLISRHWIITDAEGKTQEVRGLGVVGAQPLLAPGEVFEYTSGTMIATAFGEMRGTFFITAEDGTQFEAPIASFKLEMPRIIH